VDYTSRVRLPTILDCLAALACESEAEKRGHALDAVRSAIDARIAAAAPPAVPSAREWRPSPKRLVVGDAIHLDTAAPTLARHDREGDAFLESDAPLPDAGRQLLSLGDHRVPEAARDGYRIGAVEEALGEGSGTIDVVFGADVPYATVTQVLYTAGYQGYTGANLIVRRDGSLHALPLAYPRIEALPLEPGAPRTEADRALGGAPEAQIEHDRPIERERAMHLAEQMILEALSGDEELADVLEGGPLADFDDPDDPDREDADREVVPEAPDPEPAEPLALNLTLAIDARGGDVSASGGALAPSCEQIRRAEDAGPTFPRVDGALDAEALASCLRKVNGEFPEVTRVIVHASAETPFRDVAHVLSLASGDAEAPFPDPLLAVGS